MRRVALLVVTLFVAPRVIIAAQQPAAAPPSPQASAAAPPTAVPHDSVRGAIRAIDVRARIVEITTGVGYALRVVPLQVPAGVPVTDRQGGGAQPQAIALAQLKLGDVVRASFGGTAAPFKAYMIERLGRMATGVDSKP